MPSALRKTTEVGIDWIDELLNPGDTLGGIGDFFGTLQRVGELLADPRTYLRIFMIIFGVLLIFGALNYD